jgi:hypothetical protein
MIVSSTAVAITSTELKSLWISELIFYLILESILLENLPGL